MFKIGIAVGILISLAIVLYPHARPKLEKDQGSKNFRIGSEKDNFYLFRTLTVGDVICSDSACKEEADNKRHNDVPGST